MAVINEPNDGNGNVAVNMPLDANDAGHAQIAFKPGALAPARVARVTPEGELRIAQMTRLFDTDFNGASAGALLNSQFNQQQTTMTATLNSGFLRFNAGAVVTANIGVSINTWRVFPVRDHQNLKVSGIIRTVQGAIINKVFEFGLGFYDVAAQQSAAMNEFIGFRWTLTGGLIAVLGYSTGAGPTEVTANINGGIPYSDNVSRSYEIVVGEEGAQFWIDGALVAYLTFQPDAAGVMKSATYPVVVRQYHSGTAPAPAPQFEIGGLTVSAIGPAVESDRPTIQSAMGRHATRAQQGIQAANGPTNSVPVSGTAPGALAATNLVSGLVGLGGQGQVTLTGVVLATHTELIMCSYQNPAFPEAAGAGSNARNLVITDIGIDPLIVSAALTGGGFSASWFVAWGHTALSLATSDAIGGAAPGTKSAVKMPLPIMDTLAAAAAVGAIATRSGEQGWISLNTPIVLAPGEFIALGLRTKFVTAAVTVGAVFTGFALNGYVE